jgi:hypothetical protein
MNSKRWKNLGRSSVVWTVDSGLAVFIEASHYPGVPSKVQRVLIS